MYIKIQLRLLLMFTVIMLASFIPEYNHELFGDWFCEGSGKPIRISEYTIAYEKCNYSEHAYHEPMWHFGFRHYIWILMGLVITVLNVISIFYTNYFKTKKY